MKAIIVISVILLFAGAVYGIMDYRTQKQKGKLEQLYKDEKYNAAANEKPIRPASKKEVEAEDFSRAAIEGESETAASLPPPPPPKELEQPVSESKHKEKAFHSKIQPQAAVKVEEEEQIIVVDPQAGDTVQTVKEEKKEVRISEFSRAPIRKKSVVPERKKQPADSSIHSSL